MTPLARFRRPDYTGPNRCWPCTVLNVTILAVVSLIVALVQPLAAGLVALGGAAVIWLRGYLVPYTPRIGPRIAARLPGDVFDHDARTDTLGDLDRAADDGEAILEALVAAGVVVVEDDRVTLAEGFASTWRERMDELAESPNEALADAATAVVEDVDAARIEETGSETYLVVSGGATTAWLRRPAAIAEVAGAQVLAETDLPAASRALAAHALSMFLETCPACDDALVEGPADDCCGHTLPDHGPPEVLACERCGVALYTFEPAAASEREE